MVGVDEDHRNVAQPVQLRSLAVLSAAWFRQNHAENCRACHGDEEETIGGGKLGPHSGDPLRAGRLSAGSIGFLPDTQGGRKIVAARETDLHRRWVQYRFHGPMIARYRSLTAFSGGGITAALSGRGTKICEKRPGGLEKVLKSGGDLAVAADRNEVHTGEGAAVAQP